MIEEVQRLLDEYVAWLRDRTTPREVSDEWAEITTPHLDRHNDHLQIYIKRDESGYLLTDDGYVIQDLEQSGCCLDTPKRQGLLRVTLAGFGVRNNGGALEVHATPEGFCRAKHSLLQAMLAVNDLFCLAEPIVASLFHEDVEAWLDGSAVRYTPNVSFRGRSGYVHCFHFVVPKSRSHPERIIEAVNRPSKQAAQNLAFKWLDTREVRPPDSRAYALLNDRDQTVPAGTAEALRSYGVVPVTWNGRGSILEELAA